MLASTFLPLLASGLNQPAHYLTWGPVQISVGNLIVIGLIVGLFALAIALPFPKGRKKP